MTNLELFRQKSQHIRSYLNFIYEVQDTIMGIYLNDPINILTKYNIDKESFSVDLARFFEDFPNSNEDHDIQIKNSLKHLFKVIFPGSRINENKNSLSFRILDEKIISALKAVELIKHQQYNENNNDLMMYLEENHSEMYSIYVSLRRALEDSGADKYFSIKTKEDQDSLLFYIHIPFKNHLVYAYSRSLTATMTKHLIEVVNKCIRLSQYEDVYSNLVEQYENHINKKIEEMNEKAINQNKEIVLSSIRRDLSNEHHSVRSHIAQNYNRQIYKEADSSDLIVPGLNINVLSNRQEDGTPRFMMVPVGYNGEIPEGFEYEKANGVPFITSITSVEEITVENDIEYAKVVVGSLWSIKIQTEPFKSLLPDNYQEALHRFNEVYQEALEAFRSSNEGQHQNDSTENQSKTNDSSEDEQSATTSLHNLIKRQIEYQKQKEEVEDSSIEMKEQNELDEKVYTFFKSRLEYLSELDDTQEFFSTTSPDYSNVKDGIYYLNNNLHAFVKDPLDPNKQYFMTISPECTDPIKYLKVILGMEACVDEVPIRLYAVTHLNDLNRVHSLI